MQPLSLRDPQVYGTAAALALGAGAVLYLVFRKKPSNDELERQRRESLVRMGRIIDGTVFDTADLSEEESGRKGGMQLVMYKYEVSGVVYECSQDVSTLGDYIDVHAMRLDFPCSVRYNPHQPANSIIVAETWSGLRDLASGVPVRRGIPPRREPHVSGHPTT
ncbi:MAG: hypothetical protein ACP5M4_00600 [Acidobacteriaceae bacterium]